LQTPLFLLSDVFCNLRLTSIEDRGLEERHGRSRQRMPARRSTSSHSNADCGSRSFMSSARSWSKSSLHSPTMMSVFAVSPCFREFRRERALPALVLGPVLFCAFARFASTCFSDAMVLPPLAVSSSRACSDFVPPAITF
jgi:hypothetical protein